MASYISCDLPQDIHFGVQTTTILKVDHKNIFARVFILQIEYRDNNVFMFDEHINVDSELGYTSLQRHLALYYHIFQLSHYDKLDNLHT